MRAAIYKPSSTNLSQYIDYFLIFENDTGQGCYKTFANTNICLAFYRNNSVKWDRDHNVCYLRESIEQGTNHLFAFHRRPFIVSYSGQVRQVCIIFKMQAVFSFTHTPICEIDLANDPARQLFGKDSRILMDRLFSISDRDKQLKILEDYLLEKIRGPEEGYSRFIFDLGQLKKCCPDEKNIVRKLSSQLEINPSTLYRRFLSFFGQSPKDIYKTIRFRRTLHDILSSKQALTKTAYDHNFFDQSHFIKDIRQYTGESPGHLLKNVADVQGTMLWMKD